MTDPTDPTTPGSADPDDLWVADPGSAQEADSGALVHQAVDADAQPGALARIDGVVRRIPRPTGRRAFLLGVALWLIVITPLLVALLALRHPRWYPIADLAQTELRVHDVGSRHTPLIGLAGRIGDYFDAGSHPGPLSFWMMAPTYRLLGASAWAFATSAVALHALAVALALWLAYRRGGTPLMAMIAVGLAVLVRFYGPTVFFEPWNPYLPVLWWVVVLLSAWSVLDHDLPMLPVFIVAGSFCAQTHLPYDGLVGGLCALLGVTLLVHLIHASRRDAGDQVRRILTWSVVSVVLGFLLWVPPLIDQVSQTGNMTKIRDSMSNPTDPVTGLPDGAREILRNLSPIRLLTGHMLAKVSVGNALSWQAIAFILAWLVAAAMAVAMRHRRLMRLHLLIGVVLVLAVVSASRVFGDLWYYLFLWCWGLAMLMMVAIAWSFVLLIRPDLTDDQRRHLWPRAAAALLVLLVLYSGTAAVHNLDAEPSRADLSANLGVLARETSTALASGTVPGGGKQGRYIVRWQDPITIGSQGIGLVNELERDGFSVGVDQGFGPGAVRYRVLPEAKATGVVQLVVGPGITDWDRRTDAKRVAYVDSRSAAERAEFQQLNESIKQRLRRAGLPKVAVEWDRNLFTASLEPGIPADIQKDMLRALTVGAPAAVYVQAIQH